MRLKAMDVVRATKAHIRKTGHASFFKSVSTDSRQIEKGALFVALQGPRFDGHRFIRNVFEKGAAGAIIRKGKRIPDDDCRWILSVEDTLQALGDVAADWRQRFAIPAIAITGSNGKTTTKEFISHILSSRYQVLKTEGNFNNLVGLPLTLFRLCPKDEILVLEMGMNAPGEIDRLAKIAKPHIGVITNVGRAHLEGLGSLRAVAAAKAELLGHLPQDGLAVINADDPYVLKMAKRCRSSFLTYGFGPDAMIRGRRFKSDGFMGSSFEVRLDKTLLQIRLKRPGLYNATNALAALAVGHYYRIPASLMKKQLASVSLPYGRMTPIRLPRGITLLDDSYNANPDSVRQALRQLPSLKTTGRRILVLGDMLELGAASRKCHIEIGKCAGQVGIDLLIAVGQFADDIARGARKAGLASERIHCFETAQCASSFLSQQLQTRDLIFIKGSRGVHLETIAKDLN